MKILLDTHVLVWWLDEDKRLSKRVKSYIQDRSQEILVSAASAYEVALKAQLGRIHWRVEALRFAISEEGFAILSIDWRHTARAGGFDLVHRDPFDRIIAAQAIEDGLQLATADEKLKALYGREVLY